jgi:hypothetical protein
MTRTLYILVALAFSAILLLGRTGRSHVVPPAPGFCPLRTAEEWQQFLNHSADDNGWAVTCEDEGCDEKFWRHVRTKVQATLAACAGVIAQTPQLEKCTANFRRFVPVWLRQHDGESYGFNVDNHRYLAEQESSDKPEGMMVVPPEIVAALPDRKRVEEAARKHGFKYLTHDSAIDGIRTFVLNPDPKGRYDQWLLLNLKAGKSALASTTMPLSVLTVQKADASGRRLSKVRLHFRDYTINDESRPYTLENNESGNGKCYACHASGVRQLIARRTPVLEGKPARGETGFDEAGVNPPKDFAFSRLMEFNRRLRSYGQPDWDGKILPEDHGPVLGKAQGCTDCHDGKSRGVLNMSTSVSQVEKKVLAELGMPYDTPLPRLLERDQMKNPALLPHEERMLKNAFDAHESLTKDFEASRMPELKKWLLETPCRS